MPFFQGVLSSPDVMAALMTDGRSPHPISQRFKGPLLAPRVLAPEHLTPSLLAVEEGLSRLAEEDAMNEAHRSGDANEVARVKKLLVAQQGNVQQRGEEFIGMQTRLLRVVSSVGCIQKIIDACRDKECVPKAQTPIP